MKKWVWLFCLVVILEIPFEIWSKASEYERDSARILAITEYCEREAKKTGWTKFKIWETIKNGNWQLNVVPIKPEA